ncbi:MAG: outer membrane beta-barrel protein [Acidobacteria bacterium]|nr:outer membrane beta-barrel protein [Acidobacteriota bacterium]
MVRQKVKETNPLPSVFRFVPIGRGGDQDGCLTGDQDGCLTPDLKGQYMRSFVAAFTLSALCAAPAAAQDARVFVNGNIGSGSHTQNLAQSAEFTAYDETGSWEAQHEIKQGRFFDVGGGFRVMRNFSVGASYTVDAKDTRDVTVTARVPSPLFTDTLRTASGLATGLEHSEKALHLQALWHLPVTVQFEVTLFGGPTLFMVEDSLVESVTSSEVGGDFSAVNLQSVATIGRDNNTTGFNVGLDTRYMFVQNIGLGAMLRYSKGSVDLAPPPNTASENLKVDVGGLEIAAGLRFRF